MYTTGTVENEDSGLEVAPFPQLVKVVGNV